MSADERDPIATAVATAEEAAQRDIDARAAYYAAERPVREYRNRLVQTLNEVIRVEGEHSRAALRTREALEPLIVRCDDDLTAIRAQHRERAFDEETLETATYRHLLAHGVTPYQYAQHENPDLSSSELADTAAKRAAQAPRAGLVAYYERSIAVLVDMFADAAAGATIFAPLGEVIVTRRGRRYLSQYPTPMDLAREINRLEQALEHTRPGKRTRKT